MSQFGWLPPTDAKQADNDRYQLRQLRFAVPAVVEKTFDYPDYVKQLDQGPIGACVGFSCSWMMAHYNRELYNAYWLYKRAQAIDGDPGTKNDNDGAYIWAAGDVLRKEGHALWKTTTPIISNGITSYYWAKTIDDIRTAADLDRPPVFGIPWFSEFNSPRTVNGEFWIGTRANWGSILGGHAIWCCAVSDQRQAVRLLNTWGSSYPPVWISYASITRLFRYQSECMVTLDIAPAPPPPPPEPETKTVVLTIDNVTYAGVMTKQ